MRLLARFVSVDEPSVPQILGKLGKQSARLAKSFPMPANPSRCFES